MTSTLRVSDLARELGIPDRDLVARAQAQGMVLSTISLLKPEQVAQLRRLFQPAARPVARPAEKPVAAVAPVDASRGTVVRRRTRVEAPEAEAPVEAPPPAPTPAAPVAAAPAAPAVQAPAQAAPSEPGAAAPVAAAAPVSTYRDDRPKLRRARVEDLAPPPEMQLRVHEQAPPPVAEAEVAAAEPVPAVAPVAAEAPAEAPFAAAEPATAPAAEAAAQAGEEARVPDASLELQTIGAALTGPQPLPSSSRVPRLIKTKMPEFLKEIPKPTPRPAPAPEPAAAAAAEAGGVGVERRPTEREEPKGAARGRKLIYDRRRDTGPAVGESRMRGKKRGKGKMAAAPAIPAAAMRQEKRHIRIEDTITVANLAHQMSVKANEVIRKLFDLGIMATINHALDLDTVELVAGEFGYTVENVGFDLESYLQKPEEAPGAEAQRSPVVTVMGHVDHGKTSLLDAIRKTHTAAREAGGITQHIGAYVADVPGKGRVVFLDTPGHEAFTAMRARGAKATDVIVLVVAADDGVMPQTIEAINHAKAAAVPILVAVNKIDKPGADPEKVRRELAEHGVVAEEWGGDVTFCEVSAKSGKGIDKLLEMLALQSEIMDLKANPDVDARGLVIESRLERGRGPVATLLVQQGTLKRGQFVVSGSQYCRVRAMLDDAARPLEEAGPSTPIEAIGFDSVTQAGDEFYVVADEKKAKAIVEHRIEKQREKELLKTSKRTLEDMFGAAAGTEQRELNLIVKADVHGSAEALKAALSKIEHEEVKVRVLHSAVGGVTESDINLAATAKGVIIAFNVKPEAKGKRLADDLGVQIRQYSVIYDAIDDVTSLLEGMLTPIIEEVILGHAEVRELFSVPKLGNIAGSHVTDGKIVRSARIRVLRGKEAIWDGEIGSLRHFKDDVKEVLATYDCGIGLQGFNKINVGDRLECYELKKTARKLQPQPGSRSARDHA